MVNTIFCIIVCLAFSIQSERKSASYRGIGHSVIVHTIALRMVIVYNSILDTRHYDCQDYSSDGESWNRVRTIYTSKYPRGLKVNCWGQGIVSSFLERKFQVVNFAKFHLKWFQSIRKSSHIWLYKYQSFGIPLSSAFLKDSRKTLLRNHSCYVIDGSSNLHSRLVAAWRCNKANSQTWHQSNVILTRAVNGWSGVFSLTLGLILYLIITKNSEVYTYQNNI